MSWEIQMSSDKKFSEHELKISSELGVLKESVNGVHSKMDSMDEKLTEYCRRNEDQHKVMWSKIDTHGGLIKWIMGLGSGITIILGLLFGLDR